MYSIPRGWLNATSSTPSSFIALNSALPTCAERYRAVMRIVLCNKHMAVEAIHLREWRNMPMPPKDLVSTGSISPCAT